MSTINVTQEIQNLKSQDIGIRKKAAWLLGESSDKRAVGALLSSAKIDTDRFVRKNAVTALAKIGDSKALSTLKQIKKSDKESVVKKEAAWAIRKITEVNSRTKKPLFKSNSTVMKIHPKTPLAAAAKPPPHMKSRPMKQPVKTTNINRPSHQTKPPPTKIVQSPQVKSSRHISPHNHKTAIKKSTQQPIIIKPTSQPRKITTSKPKPFTKPSHPNSKDKKQTTTSDKFPRPVDKKKSNQLRK